MIRKYDLEVNSVYCIITGGKTNNTKTANGWTTAARAAEPGFFFGRPRRVVRTARHQHGHDEQCVCRAELQRIRLDVPGHRSDAHAGNRAPEEAQEGVSVRRSRAGQTADQKSTLRGTSAGRECRAI